MTEQGYFDAHAHYDDARFAETPGGGAAVLAELFASGRLAGVCNAASDLASSRAALALAAQFPHVYATVGIHPHEVSAAGDMELAMQALTALLEEKKAVAIGEIGLDYHYDFSPRDMQRAWFRRQMALAAELGRRVVIHNREAVGDTVSIICEYPTVCGVIHSCSCSAETVRELCARGYWISFSGSVTFRGAAGLLDAVRAVPDDRLLIETDSPYLAPVPMRGKRCDSGFLPYTAAAIAEARGATTEEICTLTRRNAQTVYKL